MTYLYERDDFANLIGLCSEAQGIANPAIVEKDYYVTEALRRIAKGFGDVAIFKGGTSLSKGWKLIDRFSEDIDLYVRPLESDEETLQRFQGVADAIMSFPGFIQRGGRSETKGSTSWTEEFTYRSNVSSVGGIRPVVLLEAGIQSADQPTEIRPLKSLLGESLDEREAASGTADREPFNMNLLHYRRTFVEKLFTIHSRVERAVKAKKPLGRDARHYYDLAMLLNGAETMPMLKGAEYPEVCSQYRELTARFYPGQVKLLPDGMNLSHSIALFPEGELRMSLEAAYKREAEVLCYSGFPAFADVLQAFEGIRRYLAVDV